YYRRSKISEAKFRHLARCFALDLNATETAHLTALSVRSTNAIFLKIRHRLAQACEADAFVNHAEVEVDESYFGPRRVPGKRGRAAGGKTLVFGIYERGGRVYTEIVENAKAVTLQRVIRGRVGLDSVIYSDGWSGYHGLVDVGYAKHLRVKHSQDQFVDGRAHVNGLESFWSFAKRRLAQFNGVPAGTFYLHLKECEWRFNHRRQDLYQALLELLRRHPI
ncbi:MAG: IS1595 family transposase, partial [Bacteroidota bacterium]